MVAVEYYRKQIELLLVWAMATTKPDLNAKLIERALEFLALQIVPTIKRCASFKKRLTS
jgi:hypothetical protein